MLGGDDAPPFMVMGCDVTHPEGGVRAFRDADAPPSVAAVVASRDTSLGRWEITPQKRRSRKRAKTEGPRGTAICFSLRRVPVHGLQPASPPPWV